MYLKRKKVVIMINPVEELEEILSDKKIYMVYQPIISLQTGNIFGYEALMRGPEDSMYRSPLELIQVAKQAGKLFDLEMMAREKAIIGATNMISNRVLLINIEPDVIREAQFRIGHTRELLKRCGLNERNVIFEITERTAITNYDRYIELIEHYKTQGYRIAIDDVGSGYSGLSRIHHTKPDYIKIDMDLVRGINKDSFKQSLLVAMVKFATMTGMKTIAEGIETPEELDTVIRLGVHYGQGYFICRPMQMIVNQLNEVKDFILDSIYKRDKLSEYDIVTCKIGTVAETVPSKKATDFCYRLKEILNGAQYEGVAIVNNNDEPIGLVMKTNLDAKMSTQYGYSIYAKRPVNLIMDYQPIIVDYDTSIKRVSEIVTLRESDKVYDNIIVTKDDKYYGMVSIKNLLQQITSIETNYARHLNPLTLLPGNKIINSIIAKTLSLNKTAAVCYIDLDNFKVYNDTYGFENGDKIIKLTAKIIEKYVHLGFPIDSFIGHIGGDDFVFIAYNQFESLEETLYKILTDFSNCIREYFNESDLEKGKIIAFDRNNVQKEFDLTSLSIGAYVGSTTKFASVEKFGEYISIIKKKAKNLSGNSYIICNESADVLCFYSDRCPSIQSKAISWE